ncbi:MAG: Hsp20/alpha crystallin family protein [Desulfurococcales archaeon]|nr:Hsp20/alpha crystallin family protein [Desulfurococcales archaeon]
MSWRPRRRKSIFDIFDEFFREIDEELYRFMRDFELFSREFGHKGKEYQVYGPYVYGFRIFIGPDGKPKIEEFGNVRRISGKPVISEEREPLVDVFEEGDEIVVIAELPGVDKDKINIKVGDNMRKLVIRASDTNRKYYKEIELPAKVDPKSAKANYRNGVLEIKLRKVKTEEKGFEIKVE